MELGQLIIEKQVKSKSSNNIYTVLVFDNAIACTCPAGGKKQICKHMVSVVYENLDKIKKEAPIFYEELMNTINIKNNKDIPYNEKLKAYSKIVYLDKNITAISIQNIKELEASDKMELEQFKPIVEYCRLYELYEFVNISRKSPYNIFFSPIYDELKKLADKGFINIFPTTFDDYMNNTYHTKDALIKILKEHNIKFPNKSNKQTLIELVNKNNLFKEDMKNFCNISANESLTTSKNIISYLHKNRSKYMNIENKKILNIRFLREDIK